jgi:preprotein translocase subunit YajC
MNLIYSGPPQASAPTSTGTATGGSWFSLIFMLLVFFLLFYFLVMLPQRRREKEFKRMISAMKRGDIVITIGGIVGKVISIDKDTVKIKTANTTELEITKRSIANVIKPKEQKEETEEKKEG